jgi:adenylosuccinate synthase
MANLIDEEQRKRKASCGMGIWFTIRRCNQTPIMLFDDFMAKPEHWVEYLTSVRSYYERLMTIPDSWSDVWQSEDVMKHFIKDCMSMETLTDVSPLSALTSYEHLIFENGQGLLLSDTGRDTADTTPSDTGITYGIRMARECGITDITAHYVTRPYLTRHGDGEMESEVMHRHTISRDVQPDRTNEYNEHQGQFRYGGLDINRLWQRIHADAKDVPYVVELTHCDEMNREPDFRRTFENVICTDKAMV